MPDFNIEQPLVVVQDQRGSSYNTGVGDANTSGLGSFLEGFQKNSRDWTVTRNLQLEAQRENDPDKLAAEQLRRQLENDKLREAVYQARVDSEFKWQEKELGIQKDQVSIESTKVITEGNRASNRITAKKAELIEKYGDQETQLGLQGQRLGNSAASLRLEQARRDNERDKLYGDDIAELEILEKAAKIGDDKDRALSGSGISDLQSSRLRAMEGKQKVLESDAYAQAQKDLEKAFKAPDGTALAPMEIARAEKDPNSALSRAKAKLAGFETEMKKFDSIEQESSSLIPRLTSEPTMSPAQQRRQRLATQADRIASKVERSMMEREEKKIAQLDYAATEAVRKASDSRRGFEIARTEAANASQARRDSDPVTGRLNSRATVASLRAVVEAKKMWSNNPEDDAAYNSLITEVVGNKESISALLNDIDASEKDPVVKAAQKKSVYGAILATGNVGALQTIQKDLATLGMGVDEIADPEKAVADTSAIIAGNAVNVQSESVKNLRGNPNTMDHITAAMKASKNGRQGFVIRQDRMNSAPSVTDTSESGQQSQMMLVYEGSDGTTATVPFVPNAESNAMWSHMERVAAAGAQQVAQNQQAQGTIAANRQEAGQRQEAMQTTPAQKPRSRQEQIEQNIELEAQASIRAWEAKEGRKASQVLVDNARQKARISYMSRLNTPRR